jgi:hypothetical protein
VRDLAAEIKRRIIAPSSDLILIPLARFFADPSQDVGDMTRLASLGYGETVTSRGHEYVGVPFIVDLPAEGAKSDQRGTMEIDNTLGVMAEAAVTLTARIFCDVEFITDADTDKVIAGPWRFIVTGVEITAGRIRLEFAYPTLSTEMFPSVRFLPHDFPGLFVAVD